MHVLDWMATTAPLYADTTSSEESSAGYLAMTRSGNG
jgi:hypothetical protein